MLKKKRLAFVKVRYSLKTIVCQKLKDDRRGDLRGGQWFDWECGVIFELTQAKNRHTDTVRQGDKAVVVLFVFMSRRRRNRGGWRCCRRPRRRRHLPTEAELSRIREREIERVRQLVSTPRPTGYYCRLRLASVQISVVLSA